MSRLSIAPHPKRSQSRGPRSLPRLPRNPVRRVETRLNRIRRMLRVGDENLFYLHEDDLRAVLIRGLDETAHKRLRHDIEYVQRDLIRLLGETSKVLSLLELSMLSDSDRWGPALRLTRLARERLREGTAIEEEVHNRLVEFARQGRSEEFRWLARSQGVPEESLDTLWQGTCQRLRRQLEGLEEGGRQ